MKVNSPSSSVVISSKPIAAPANRETLTDPIVVTGKRKLMTRKLRKILRDWGDNVFVRSSLVLDILEGYMKKSKQLKSANVKIEELERRIKELERR